jgi:uncharacterized protein with beta-barrel porin domain
VPETSDGGVSNSPTAAYPTAKFLDINFLRPAYLQSFIFNNEGTNTPGSVYRAYGAGGVLLRTGDVSTLEGNTPLVLNLSGVTMLQFDNATTAQGDSWIFELDSITFQAIQLTFNQTAVSNGINHAIATGNPGIQTLENALNNSNLGVQGFDEISGEEYTSIFDTDFSTAHQDNLNITNHLYDLQNGNPGGYTLGLATGTPDGKSTVDGKDSKNVVTPAAEDRWSFFASANGGYTDVSGDGNANGFTYASEGITLGLDYKLLPNVVVGSYLGYNHVFTTLVNSGAIDQNGVTGGLYGSWFSNGFYVNGIVGGGYSGFTARRLTIGGFARGDSDSAVLNTLIGGGYDLHHGGWTFGPTVALEYDEAGLDSFTENGSLAPLHTFGQSQDSLRSTVGAHISYETHINGLTVRPDLHASWQHEYDDEAAAFGANVAGTNAGFVVQGPNLGRDSALAGAGVTVDLDDKSAVYVNYEGQFGRANLTQSIVSLGYRLKF